MSNCVAVIPARGGSKRIPWKNIREFSGKPMIAWSILAARESGLFDRIIISTDSPEVAAIARDFGAETPFERPPHLASDEAPIRACVTHAVEWLRENAQQPPATCCLIYATAPFISAADLRAGKELLERDELEYVLAVSPYPHPVERAFYKDSPRSELKLLFPDAAMRRSQELRDLYHDAAQFCWGTAEAWTGPRNVFTGPCGVVEIDRWRVCDIDQPRDWEFAEYLAAGMKRAES